MGNLSVVRFNDHRFNRTKVGLKGIWTVEMCRTANVLIELR